MSKKKLVTVSSIYYIKQLLSQRAQLTLDYDKFEVQHGDYAKIIKTDLQPNMHSMFFWNKRLASQWSQEYDVPAYCVGAPYIFYRKENNIQKDVNAKGTVVFPAHGTKNMPAIFNVDHYCTALKSLPEKFHPITICVFWADITQFAIHVEYLKHGFNVTCVFLEGNNYPEGLYNILKRHQYASSNIYGSYSLYAVEMGIPFFLFGEDARYDNRLNHDPNKPKSITSTRDSEEGELRYKLFKSSPRGTITAEQEAFVHKELGLDEHISAEELRTILMPIQRDPAIIDTTDEDLADLFKQFKEAAKS